MSREPIARRPAAERGLVVGSVLRIPDGVVVACEEEPDAWFPEEDDGKNKARGDHIKLIQRICRACPIRDDCAEFAIAHPEIRHGIWGGLTHRQRQDERRRLEGAA